jgi:F0F1-type ATP synthase assembly protein I
MSPASRPAEPAVDPMPSEDYDPDERDKLNKPDGGISWRQAMGTVGLALAIPGMIGVPALIGYWIDNKYATAPLWLIVGLVLGLLTTALDIYKLMKRFGQFK